MFPCRLCAVMALCAAALATVSLRRAGWLDRMVAYHKNNFFNDIDKYAPIQISAEIRPKPAGYVDSRDWDYSSVIRLLTLIRESENTMPVQKYLRRMLKPTRRIMMSIKDSFKHFPSLTKHGVNEFYYDEEYIEDEMSTASPIPDDEVVLVVSNPVEARLPSARISVSLLRDILVARARAARQMPTTPKSTIPWIPMNKTTRGHDAGTNETDSKQPEAGPGAEPEPTTEPGDGTETT